MSRFFVPMSVGELRKKFEIALEKRYGNCEGSTQEYISDVLFKDLKIDVDFENFEEDPDNAMDKIRPLMGYNTLENGFTFLGVYAGGDWEYPVFMIIYSDGRRMRLYVPTDGNPWNTSTKMAYGNDELSDIKNIKKRFPELLEDGELMDDPTSVVDFNAELIKNDIMKRITLKDES